ncbi:ABC transporter ATP-binding protein [Pseudonocardia sichuanensis]|uniref:ATP-binding cassette subfamily B protein n=1 Tax=Pseudonocardia kunmingensis TaxID=630975 RepID=A0A543D9Q9_9PSEU|nr:ABC transporter ATP-binding protein [Pseudonocardia kunmingensis]TQM06062.1 ATP-binding cassette subfamily B protein [Pseudonocardia kunmingensis]
MSTAEAIPTHSAVAQLLAPIRGRLALAVVLQAVSSALVLAPLIGVGELARILLAAPIDAARAWTVVLTATGLLAAGLALRGAADLTTHLADNTFTLQLRRRLATALSAAPLGWFSEHASGRIKQGMQDDVSAIHHLIGHAFTNLAAAVTTPLIVYGYLFWVDWRLALVLLAPLPVFAGMYRRMMAGSAVKMSDYGQVLAEVNDATVEFVHGIPVVKTFGRAGHAHHAYGAAVDRFTAFFLGWSRPLIRPETVAAAALAPVTMVLLTLLPGTWLLATAAMDPTDLLPFLLLGPGIGAPIAALTASTQSLQLARGAAARVGALLDITPMPRPAHPLVPVGTTVQFDQVGFSYDSAHQVLDDVTLTLEPGTVTALVGASGSGKSTLARLLLRFFDPTAGRIRLGGVDLARITPEQLYQRVGFVFQDVALLRASIAENIALGRPHASRDQVVAAARAANIHHVVDTLPRGYDSVYGEDAHLSGGQAQRVAIARALLLDPPLLVLDEPTSAADAESERAVQDALSTLAVRDQAPRTVLVIAHRLDSITAADQIVVLDGGRIVERGTHRDLLAAGGRYAQLWRIQHLSGAEVN